MTSHGGHAAVHVRAEGDAATSDTGGTLYVVATPIGNLGDVTIRALEILRTVPLIAAEDTRHARRLLDRYEVVTRTVSYHARSGPGRTAELLAHLTAGEDLALVTDAGTPGISDPGDALVIGWAAAGGRVVPVPGASAVVAAVSASGVAGGRWAFEGFLPRSGSDRRERLALIAADERGTVLYEAPGRVTRTLANLAEACGPDRPGAVCRELTKIHESIVRGSLGDLAAMAAEGQIPARGEFVLIVGARPSAAKAERAEPSDDDLQVARAAVERLVASGMARSAAARQVAAESGMPRRRLYDIDPPR